MNSTSRIRRGPRNPGLSSVGAAVMISGLISVWVLAACRGGESESRPGTSVIATVGKKTVLLSEFENELSFSTGESAVQDEAEFIAIKESLLDQLINQRLILQEAERLGLEVTSEEVQAASASMRGSYSDEEFSRLMADRGIDPAGWEESLRRKLLVQKAVGSVTDGSIEIPEEEIRRYYDSHLEDFRNLDAVRARQIVVPGRDEAAEIRNLLLQNNDFAEVARSRSISPDYVSGGSLGIFSKGEMPEEFDVVFDLSIGQISPVVKSPYGYHLFKVEEKIRGRQRTLEEVSEEIERRLIEQERKKRYADWLAALRAGSDIRIDRELLVAAKAAFMKPPGNAE